MDKITPSLEAATATTAKGTSIGYVPVSVLGIITHVHCVRGGLTVSAPVFLNVSRPICSKPEMLGESTVQMSGMGMSVDLASPGKKPCGDSETKGRGSWRPFAPNSWGPQCGGMGMTDMAYSHAVGRGRPGIASSFLLLPRLC